MNENASGATNRAAGTRMKRKLGDAIAFDAPNASQNSSDAVASGAPQRKRPRTNTVKKKSGGDTSSGASSSAMHRRNNFNMSKTIRINKKKSQPSEKLIQCIVEARAKDPQGKLRCKNSHKREAITNFLDTQLLWKHVVAAADPYVPKPCRWINSPIQNDKIHHIYCTAHPSWNSLYCCFPERERNIFHFSGDKFLTSFTWSHE